MGVIILQIEKEIMKNALQISVPLTPKPKRRGNTMDKKCDKCKHRRSIPGDAHSECKHPSINEGDSILALLGSSSPSIRDLNIQANPHGIKMGWFTWPVNFDPVWLENCEGFEENE